MEPRVLRVERVFPNSFLQGRDYTWFQYVFDSLVEEMKLRICGFFIDKQATFVLNQEMYRLFYSVAPMNRGPYWDGIYVKEDLTPDCIPWDKDEKPKGRILLEYREPVYIPFELTERRSIMPPERTKPYDFYYSSVRNTLFSSIKPHIDHVKFNGPATIVFWKDGTKTVVKHDGKGRKDKRQAILYAFIRKIYGEGKPYHNILNEIEESIK